MTRLTPGQIVLGVVLLLVALAVCVLNDRWNRWLARRRESRRGFEIRTATPAEPPAMPAQADGAPQRRTAAAGSAGAHRPGAWSLARAFAWALITGNVSRTTPDGRVRIKCPRCGSPVSAFDPAARPDADPTYACPGCGEKITITSVPLLPLKRD